MGQPKKYTRREQKITSISQYDHTQTAHGEVFLRGRVLLHSITMTCDTHSGKELLLPVLRLESSILNMAVVVY